MIKEILNLLQKLYCIIKNIYLILLFIRNINKINSISKESIVNQIYPMKFIPLYLHPNYEKYILPLLQQLKYKQMKNVNEIVNAMNQLQFYIRTKNKGHSQPKTRLKIMKSIYNKELTDIFSLIANQIISYLPEKHGKLEDINILLQYKQQNNQIHFTKTQIVYLMSLMAFNLVPEQEYEQSQQRRDKFPYTNNFKYIFQNQQYKTMTIIQYFKQYFRTYKKHFQTNNQKSEQKYKNNQQKKQKQKEQKEQKQKEEMFTIQRKFTKDRIQDIIKSKSDKIMSSFSIQKNQTSIQEFYGSLKIDFANKYIGGGALHSGCVQEEIMFANHPQLFTTVLFCEVMNKNQALILIGYKKYSSNTGYGWSAKYDKQHSNQQLKSIYPSDEMNRAKQYIVAIDAINFHNFKNGNLQQFSAQCINREIIKAFTGFNCLNEESKLQQKLCIITGNWGCGAFRGQIRLKFLIQWIAASLTGRKMVYCPFGALKKLQEQRNLLEYLSKKSIRQVYRLLLQSANTIQESLNQNILQRIIQIINQKQKHIK